MIKELPWREKRSSRFMTQQQEARYELDAGMFIFSSTKQAVKWGLRRPWTTAKDGVPALGIIRYDTAQKWMDTDVAGSLFDKFHLRTGLTQYVDGYAEWIKQVYAHNTFRKNGQEIFELSRPSKKPAYIELTPRNDALLKVYVWASGISYILLEKVLFGEEGFVIPQAYRTYRDWLVARYEATTYDYGKANKAGLPANTVTNKLAEKCRAWRSDLRSVQLVLPRGQELLRLTPPSVPEEE